MPKCWDFWNIWMISVNRRQNMLYLGFYGQWVLSPLGYLKTLSPLLTSPPNA